MHARKQVTSTNRLIAALPERGRRRFLAGCDRVNLKFAEVLCQPGERLRHVYFPLDGFISQLAVLEDGARLEVGMVGDEGMWGAPLVLGVNVSQQQALVQGSGTALRMSAELFQRHLQASAPFRQGLSTYVYVVLGQLAQTAACTRYHFVEARLARWLLMTRDRAHSNHFRITHEFLAHMLGVRRVGITRAATALQLRGLIEYRRGKVDILDSAGLAKAACQCYRQGNAMYERALGRRRRAAQHRH